MSEVVFASDLGRHVAAIESTGRIAGLLAGKKIDGRRISPATSAAEAVELTFEKIKNQ